LHSGWFWQIAWQSEAWEICSICSIRDSGSSHITPSVTSQGARVVSAIVVVVGIIVVVVGGLVVSAVAVVVAAVTVVVVSAAAVVVPMVVPTVVGGMVVVPMVVSWQSDKRGLAGPLRQPSQGSTVSQAERR